MSRSEELRVSAGDATLAATLTLPDAPPPPERRGRYPNALLLPSWLARDRDGEYDVAGHPDWFASGPAPPGILARLAGALAERGVASLRADPRGCGTSDGAWEEVDLFTRIDDARDMLAAMRSDGRLDLRRSGVAGHGEGATIALAVAIGDPAVSALTLIGPAARSWRTTLRRAAAARRRDGDQRHPLVAAIDRWSEDLIERAERREQIFSIWLRGGGTLTIRLAGFEQAINTPSLALATMLHRSVALVHGSEDTWSQADESALLARALAGAGEAPSLRVVAGAGHDLAEAGDQIIGELADDLAARLLPIKLPPVLVAIDEMG